MRLVVRSALARSLGLALLLALSAPVLAVTVTRTPAAASDCTSTSLGGTKSWSNPGLAASSDNSFTTASVDGTSTRYLQCLNYGFSIPDGAVIQGITVTVTRKSNNTGNGGSRDAAMRLVKGGSIGSTDRATSTAYTKSSVSERHGGSADLWGETWTPADVNAANFGAAFAATKPSGAGKRHTVSVDIVSITVDYASDIVPPTVVSIQRASFNPASGSTAAWNVTFSEPVSGVDAGDFTLVASGVTGASISSVTGSGASWTVTAGTGSGNGTLGLNLVDNDTIVDTSGNRLGGNGSGNGNLTGQVYTVDKIIPNALSITRTAASPSASASMSWTISFGETVTGVDAGDFALVTTGSVAASLTTVTGAGTTWTVTAASVTGTGTLGLNLVDNDTILDTALNRLGGTGLGNGSQTGEVYVVDRDAPSVLSITRNEPSPSSANEVTWTVTFSENVTGVGAADFALAASGLSGASITQVSGSGSTWVVAADPGYGSGTLGLNFVDDDSVIDAVGNRFGGTGLGNGNFAGEVYVITIDPLASYRFDEGAWNGSTGEVADQQGTNPGTAKNGATTAGATAALAGSPGSCRYGVFYSAAAPSITSGYVDLGIDFPYQTESFTVAAWVRTSSNAAVSQWIFTHNTSGSGYALNLGTAGAGRLRFSSGGASTVNLDSPSAAASLLANDSW